MRRAAQMADERGQVDLGVAPGGGRHEVGRAASDSVPEPAGHSSPIDPTPPTV